MTQKKTLSPFNVATTAVFTAFVAVATMVISIYVPSTKGFFNIGESMVFLSALLFGPFVGAFAGGVGSMIADVLLGFVHYAPATLLIKACEGGIVGILAQKRPAFRSKALWRAFTVTVGLVFALLLGGIGSLYYSGTVELYLGIPAPLVPNVTFSVSPYLWYVLGAIIFFLTSLAGFHLEPEFGWTVFSIIVGGLVMVTGYFLYQMFFIGWLFNIQVVAVAEIPINIGQMIIGAVLALPAARIVWRAFPHLKS